MLRLRGLMATAFLEQDTGVKMRCNDFKKEINSRKIASAFLFARLRNNFTHFLLSFFLQLCESYRRIFNETCDQKSERIRNRDGRRKRSESLFNRRALGSDGSGSIYKMQSRNAAGAQFCIKFFK